MWILKPISDSNMLFCFVCFVLFCFCLIPFKSLGLSYLANFGNLHNLSTYIPKCKQLTKPDTFRLINERTSTCAKFILVSRGCSNGMQVSRSLMMMSSATAKTDLLE